MTLEEQTKKLIEAIANTLNDNKDLSEAILPALTAIMTATVDSHIDHDVDERERYIYCMRGYSEGGKPTVVSVDYDILPLLCHLEEGGIAEFAPTDIIPLMKYPDIEEDEIPDKLH